MGSHFITLHACALENVRSMLGSRDRAILKRLENDERNEHEQALGELIDGTYDKDDSAQSAGLIRAFELLCKLVSKHSVTIEMYDDEEEAPLLWSLCWEGEDAIELPISDEGTPAVTYHAPGTVKKLLPEFQKLKKKGGYDEQYLNSDSLADILKALEAASSMKCGLFGFVEY